MIFPTALLWLLVLPADAFGQSSAIELYERGEFQRAVTVLSQQAHSLPEADTHFWLGKVFLKLRKWDAAIDALKSAVQSNPASSLYHLWLGRAYGEKASRVSFFTAFGWARRVLQEFETAGKLEPGNLDARFDLLQYYLDAPGVIGGGRDKAETQAKEIARLNPRLGYRARAMIFLKDKKWDRAKEQFVRATGEFKESPEVWLDLASFLFDRSDFAGALNHARMALTLKSPYPEAELISGKSEIRLGTGIGEAEARLRRLASGALGDNDPSFDDVYYWLGEAYMAGSKKAEARQAFETALRFNPEHAAAKSALSRIL